MAARTIVLLGKTGDGKSSVGNTILDEDLFISTTSAVSETGCVRAEERTIYGRNTTIVDMPGLFSTKSPDALKAAIEDCIDMCSPGPNVFIIILRLRLYGEQERQVVKEIESLLGEELYRHSVVLFTHGDDLNEGQTIEEFVEESKELKELVEKCGGRCHVLDNMYWNQEHKYRSNSIQVKKLLNSIDELIEENGGDCYTKEMLKIWQRKRNMNRKDKCIQVIKTVWSLIKTRVPQLIIVGGLVLFWWFY